MRDCLAIIDERDARSKAEQGERRRHEAERRQREVAKAQIEYWRSRGIPAKDIRLIANGRLRETAALRGAREFIASDLASLVLSGPRGCGKTTAASWVASEVRGAMFLDVSRVARLNRYDSASMDPAETCSLLVVDDLGQEFADERGAFLATFDGLFNARYSGERRTIITTNLTAADFKRRYGDRIADRIRETGDFLELNGSSMRGRK